MTFVPATGLPKSHRPPSTMRHRIQACGICRNPTEYDKLRNLNRVEGFQHRKQGVACDDCVKGLHDRRVANQIKMAETRGEAFL